MEVCPFSKTSKAFSLKEGQISNVFKTRFGYHIIQMVSRSGDDATIRHILKIPQVSSIEVNDTKGKLDSVRANLMAGTMKFGEAVAKFSEDETSKFTGGRIPARDGGTFLTIDQLDKDLVSLLPKLKAGEFSQPVVFTDERGKKGVRIVYLKTRTEPHRENLKDDYNRIAQKAIEEKKSDAMEKWFTTKIPTYYIMVDDDYKTCPKMNKWTARSTAKSSQ